MKPKLLFLKPPVFFIGIVLFCLSIVPDASAQYETESEATIPLDKFYIKRQGTGFFRKIISKVTIGLSTGYGRTPFRHELDGFGILQNPDSLPRIYSVGDPTLRYSNWTTRSTTSSAGPMPGAFQVNSDTAEIGFKSKSFTIPLKATLHVEFLDRYRIGGGYSMDFTHLGNYEPLKYGESISSFAPADQSFFLKKYFGMIGGSVYRYYEYLLVVDLNVGGYKLGKAYDNSVIKRGVFINLGATVEREMSEYFKLFVRPSYEIKRYKMNVPGGESSVITHHMNGWYINFGATYRLPELRRCFLKGCHAQLNHAHGNREYRSRRHAIWKKQNPHYGENYPELIKYKGKNKHKLNPY